MLAVLATLVVAGLTGCGDNSKHAEGSTGDAATRPATGAIGSPTPSATGPGAANENQSPTSASGHVYDTAWKIAPVTAPKMVKDAYGHQLIHDAYSTVVALTKAYAFDPDAASPQHDVPKALLLGPRKYMDNTLRPQWDLAVRKVLAKGGLNTKYEGDVAVIMLFRFGSNDPKWHLPTSGPIVVQPQITSASADFGANGTMNITIKARAIYRESYGTKPYLAPVTKTVTYTLIQVPAPADADPWLLDSWHGRWQSGKTHPDKHA